MQSTTIFQQSGVPTKIQPNSNRATPAEVVPDVPYNCLKFSQFQPIHHFTPRGNEAFLEDKQKEIKAEPKNGDLAPIFK